ncbi:hypothetical protein FRC17_004912 [Serendipita sp. 399]|nr:hypothetical protein FRC17_004912 [Serendipita sp. 399]
MKARDIVRASEMGTSGDSKKDQASSVLLARRYWLVRNYGQAIEGQAEEAKYRAQEYRRIISTPAGVNSATNTNTDEQLALGAEFLLFGAMENDELHRRTAAAAGRLKLRKRLACQSYEAFSDSLWREFGKYGERDLPDYSSRDFVERGFTIGIGGPVGSGKTALTLALCRRLRSEYNIAVTTNDIFTREDQEFLLRNEALPADRIRAIETGGCPHAAIREDISANMGSLEELTAKFGCQLLFVESGGDNLAANYSRELADYIIYVIDVAGGDKIPRKGGPGISQSDLLVINKIDIAQYVGASLEVMDRDSKKMRDTGPTIFTSVKEGTGVDEIIELVLAAWKSAGKPGKPGGV